MSSYALIPCTIWLLVALPRFQAACPTCTICSQPTSVVYAGYTYRTLYNASLYGKGYTTDEEHTYFPMPVGFEVAPDDTDINDYVVAPFDWDAYRLCTQSKCVHGRYYGDDAGSISDDEIMWETDGNGNYRIKPSSSSYYRLLIREQACTPISTCTICSQPTSVAYAGYTYRTLYNASLNGKDYSNKIEQTYFPMPVGFEVAPDDSDIYDYVVAPFDWDIYRVCTQSKCGKGRYYGDDAGSNYDKDKWETDGNGNYRAKGGLFGLFDDNHRLLIRKANVCNCPNGTAQTTPDCNTDQATECSSCNPGYFGITCQANVCDCPNGVARIAPACTTDQATECSSCNPGYSGTTCQANVCDCPNGVARVTPNCTTDQATECSSCNPGYSGTTCQAHAISLSGGHAAGTSTLRLSDVSSLSAGMSLTITGGGNSETKTIVSVNPDSSRRLVSRRLVAPGSVIIDSGLQNAYPDGASIVAIPQATTTTKTATTVPTTTILTTSTMPTTTTSATTAMATTTANTSTPRATVTLSPSTLSPSTSFTTTVTTEIADSLTDNIIYTVGIVDASAVVVQSVVSSFTVANTTQTFSVETEVAVIYAETVPAVALTNGQTTVLVKANDIVVSLPASFLSQLYQGKENDNVAVVMQTLKNNSHFTKGAEETGRRAIGPIISLDISYVSGGQIEVSGLEEGILLTIPVTESGGICSFWDESKSAWSHEGVTTLSGTTSSLLCKTTHLSFFSGMILDELGTALRCDSWGMLTAKGLSQLVKGAWWYSTAAIGFYLLVTTLILTVILAILQDRRWAREELWDYKSLFVVTGEEKHKHRSLCEEFVAIKHIVGDFIDGTKEKMRDLDFCVSDCCCRPRKFIRALMTLVSRIVVDRVTQHTISEKHGIDKKLVKGLGGISSVHSERLRERLQSAMDDGPQDVATFFSKSTTIFTRILIIFRCTQPWFTLGQFSMTITATFRALLFCAQVVGAVMALSLFYSSTGMATGVDSDPACAPKDGLRAWIRDVLIGYLSFTISFLPVGTLMLFRSRSFRKISHWDEDAIKKTIRRWILQDHILQVVIWLYISYCVFFVALFLANVDSAAHKAWLISTSYAIFSHLVIKPLQSAVVLALIASLFQRCRPDVAQQKQERMRLHRSCSITSTMSFSHDIRKEQEVGEDESPCCEDSKRVSNVASTVSGVEEDEFSQHAAELDVEVSILQELPNVADLENGFCHQYSEGNNFLLSELPELYDNTMGSSEVWNPFFSGGELLTITFARGMNDTLGLVVSSNDGVSLQIDRLEDGLIKKWNSENALKEVREGDCIVCVNGLSGNAQALMDEFKNTSDHLTLIIQSRCRLTPRCLAIDD